MVKKEIFMENRLLRNSISAVVVIAMVMSIFAIPVAIGGSEAYGDTGEMKAATSSLTLSESDIDESITQGLSLKAQDISVKSTDYINVKTLVTGNESLEEATLTPKLLSGTTNKYGYRQAVTLAAKGTLYLVAGSADKYLTFGLYSDEALSSPIETWSSSKGTKDDKFFKIPKSGKYYIGVYSTDSTATLPIYMAAAYVNGADRTIYSGKQVAVGARDAQTSYFKFKATKTGYLQVQTETGLYAGVYLYNSKKKALSSKTSSSYAPTYGVKKGSTYYVRIDTGYISYSNGGYVFKVTNKKISEKSGKKRTKAVTLKKNKTKKGTIIAGSSQADWYKAKLTSKKKMTITLKGATNDKLKITIYDKKGKKISGGNRYYYYTDAKLVLKSSYKLSKGTYYFKISRANKKSSGWYSIKWK